MPARSVNVWEDSKGVLHRTQQEANSAEVLYKRNADIESLASKLKRLKLHGGLVFGAHGGVLIGVHTVAEMLLDNSKTIFRMMEKYD